MSNQNEEWQPIETAPKDGTPILAWNGRNQITIKWDQVTKEFGHWSLLETGDYAISSQPDDEPTLWKELGPNPDLVVGL
jgi:hypothetical protein